ncbi:MAG: o-succinylbenzoate synthase [Cyanobacteria bacterium P01_E01_bin.42]
MVYKLKFNIYQYPFKQSLRTHHGTWKIREGIIISLLDEINNIGRGEIAPLPWFGSETLTEAMQFLETLGEQIEREDIFCIPHRLPACQFAFESALEELERPTSIENYSPTFSYLLPAGKRVLQQWKDVYKQGGRTLKWKIGVESIEAELKLFQQLTCQLPTDIRLRLDANGGLNLDMAKRWLEAAERAGNIEFIEQPLPPENLSEMIKLKEEYRTDISLDESVATLRQLESCYHQGWQGIYVIKAAIAGSPQRLRQICREYAIAPVFSSVFETEIGRTSILRLARELSSPQRALGMGINAWFDPSYSTAVPIKK